MTKVLVTGAAGSVGGHLCRYLKDRGYWVRAVDHVDPRYGDVPCDEGLWNLDLRKVYYARTATRGMDWVFALAADMGGMGFISRNHFGILKNNALINVNMARTADRVDRVLFTSSACVYPERLQMDEGEAGTKGARGLEESHAWAGKPDTAYGIEKLFSEELYTQLASGFKGRQTRIARFHNIFGPRGSWNDGREKAPAALCRKVAVAKLTGNPEVEIWGDGRQTRSFCYVDDCLEMLMRLMLSDWAGPLNIGTDRLVSINELADTIADVAGIKIVKKHDLSKPQGVRGRNADLTLMRDVLNYEPQVSLEEGLAKTYAWIETQARKELQ